MVARIYGPMGISGAELRIDGLPTNWQYVVTANPAANLVLGDLFVCGANIAFLQGQVGDCLWLFRIALTATSAVDNVTLAVVRYACPSQPDFECPLVALDDPPVFTRACVPGGTMTINGEACGVGVAERPWSAVKSMYRE